MKHFLILGFLLLTMISCQQAEKMESIFIPKDIVIAHRGTTYWAPEETEAAYRWARNIGADYLEVDIQRSQDGVLMALHDMVLTRTTNISQIYPEKSELNASEFTFEELMKLDAGSWFNLKNPDREQIEFSTQSPLIETDQIPFAFEKGGAKVNYPNKEMKAFVGGYLGISTLEDVIRIAEGYRIAKDEQGNRLYERIEENGQVLYRFFYVEDVSDLGHRPGVYIETKEPHLFPGLEKDLFSELDRLGWNILTLPTTDTLIRRNNLVRVGETIAKIILQTFSPESLRNLQTEFQGKVPTTFLLWLGDPNMPLNDSISYFENLEFAKKNGAHIIGPSIAGEPNNYDDLLNEDNFRWIKKEGFLIHPYSFDTDSQTLIYGPRSDGMFTNRAELTLKYYKRN